MEIGEIKTLNKNNVFRVKNWGIKGEKVKIISISGTAVVYENRKGNRFPCNINDLE
ncbi:hypothetical protein HZP67_10040 [Elizabethkingia anophelis]|nr:hypothetical protein [Elizabethkingia anophelis]MCT4148180.1 hypothetical protein [Elizabethkingia anophelis]